VLPCLAGKFRPLLSEFLREFEAQGKTVLVEGLRDYFARKRYLAGGQEHPSIRKGALQAMAPTAAAEKRVQCTIVFVKANMTADELGMDAVESWLSSPHSLCISILHAQHLRTPRH
jgi:hypothetical protein